MSVKDPNPPFHYPSPREDFILTISCGNTHLHWATHHGANEDFNPKIFWRTPHISAEDMASGNLINVLSRLIPDDAHDYIWGPENDASKEAAIEQSKLRAVPEISVYVISSNPGQADMLEKLLQTIPSKFCVIQGDMFFTEDQGRYPTMGADRLATLAGAAHMHGHPALVFDGGTATTYAGTDCNGRILGGGIGPGIRTKLKSMAETTADLPDLTSKVDERVNAAIGEAGNGPLPTFATNTEDAMLGDVFQELAMKGRNVINNWLQKAFKSSKPRTAVFKHNADKRVICTGGDGDVLHLLLSPDSGGLIEVDDQEEPGYTVEVCKHLIHYGVTAVLYSHVKLQQKKDEFVKKNADEHVGKRVAKVFDMEDDGGDNIFRGTVEGFVEVDGKKEYRIKYDDGDVEDVFQDTLFELFELYTIHGEKTERKKSHGSKMNSKSDQVKSSKPGVAGKEKKAPKTDSDSAKVPKKKKGSDHGEDAPAAKKPKIDTYTDMVKKAVPTVWVKRRVAKIFDGEVYFGTITQYDDIEDPPFWKVEFDDGDAEDWESKDLVKALKLYDKRAKEDPQRKTMKSVN